MALSSYLLLVLAGDYAFACPTLPWASSSALQSPCTTQALINAGLADRDDWIKVLARAASRLNGRLELDSIVEGMPSVCLPHQDHSMLAS